MSDPSRTQEIEKPIYTPIIEMKAPPYCPVQDSDGNLFIVCNNGDIHKVNEEEGTSEVHFSTNGQPTSLVFDQEGSSFIADWAHQSILS